MGYRRPGSAKLPFGILFLVVVVSFVMVFPLRLIVGPFDIGFLRSTFLSLVTRFQKT